MVSSSFLKLHCFIAARPNPIPDHQINHWWITTIRMCSILNQVWRRCALCPSLKIISTNRGFHKALGSFGFQFFQFWLFTICVCVPISFFSCLFPFSDGKYERWLQQIISVDLWIAQAKWRTEFCARKKELFHNLRKRTKSTENNYFLSANGCKKTNRKTGKRLL